MDESAPLRKLLKFTFSKAHSSTLFGIQFYEFLTQEACSRLCSQDNNGSITPPPVLCFGFFWLTALHPLIPGILCSVLQLPGFVFSRMSCKWNPTVGCILRWPPVHWAQSICDVSVLLGVSFICSSLWPSGLLFRGMHHGLFIHSPAEGHL